MPTGRTSHCLSINAAIGSAAMLLLLAGPFAGRGLWAQARPAGSPSQAVPRIASGADLTPRYQLAGHSTRWATAANDDGPVPASTPLHLQLLLTRDAAREAAFQQRLAGQQDRSSPYFHQWLTPAQLGALYGPAAADIDAIQAWLTTQGLRVDSVAPSGIFIQFSGTADAIEQAFQTSLHLYRVPWADPAAQRTWRAPAGEPTIPAAFQPVVAAIEGLADIPLTTPHHISAAAPQESNTNGTHLIAPSDFAAIYDLAPVYNLGIDGTGVRIAIIGMSQVNPADIAAYQAMFNLRSTSPTVRIAAGASDPGQQDNDYQLEATLDVERVVSTAQGAQPDLVLSSEASGGLITAISHNVQVLIDPVMTLSFSQCEADAGQAMTGFYAGLFSQAAAEGISTFVSAGDSGAAGCDDHGFAPPATQTLSINAFCSSGFVTCVGGTEFNDTANPHLYWAPTNSPNLSSALGYIPEGVWNEPTTGSGTTTIAAGGGGSSIYDPKPAFQTGPGVPADGWRDVPDISFSASGHDGYVFCYLVIAGGPCTRNAQGMYLFTGAYGTSAAAPSMAAITALLNQQLGGPQGVLNPLIYRLANRVYSTAFHDVTLASSGMANNCTAATPSLCNNSTPSPSALTGGLAGYLVATAYDQATGWGSLDVANFISAALGAGLPTTSTLSGSAGNVAGTQPLNFSVTVAPAAPAAAPPSGGVQFYLNGAPSGTLQTLSPSGQATYTISSATLPDGVVQVTASYTGDTTFDASTSNSLALNVSAAGTAADSLALAVSPTSVDPTVSGTITATFAGIGKSTAPAALISLYNLDSGSLALYKVQPQSGNVFSIPFSILSAGPHTFVATYPGDSVFAPVTSAPLTISVAALPTATILTGPPSTGSGSGTTLSATVSGLLNYNTGLYPTVEFFDGNSLIGTAQPALAFSTTSTPASIITATATISPKLAAGSHSITAVWPGDLFTSASTSAPLVIVSLDAGITVTPAAQQVTLPAPGATALDALAISSFGGFSGSENLACAVTYSGPLTISSSPACSLSNSTVTLAAGGTASSVLTLSTVGPQTAAALATRAPPGFLVLCIVGFIPALVRRRRLAAPLHWRAFLVASVAAALWLVSGCGNSSQPATPQTTPATYTVNISGGSGGTMNVLTTITLTVQ